MDRSRLACLLALLAAGSLSQAQFQPEERPPLTAARVDPPPGAGALLREPPKEEPEPEPESGFEPTWETQKHARTYLLGIPAPRGQIVDRHGRPLAQTRVSYNLAISFPTPLTFTDRQVQSFVQQQVQRAQSIIGRRISLSTESVLKHYKNRGVLPFVIAQDLQPPELESFERAKSDTLTLQPVYQRFYPHGALAGHVIGYAGRDGRMQDGPIQNNELLWPNAKGRDGLEDAFDEQLQGKIGQFNISFDATGKKASEQISIPPQPGYNVVTTLDLDIQRMCEEALAKGAKRGAIVITDPNNGDILALASWPTIDPNAFVPTISPEAFKALQDDKDIPLLPRAYRAAYPPGSTFKVFVGLAALQSGNVGRHDEFSCPPSLRIGKLTFRNWKKGHAGSLNFVEALTQSCNTWFYQVGMQIGAQPIVDTCAQLGLGARTGIPLNAETHGRLPTDEYMMKVYNRRFLNGDLANLSIGQGDTIISPLQMAQAMGVVGNGGMLYQARLVQQVQSLDNQIVTGYSVRARAQMDIDPKVHATLRQAMVGVVSSRSGTAGRASVPGIQVAGKTGTAQWGPKNNERTVAWFAGFAPAENPKYAFAATYEGDARNDDVHGGTEAAPLIGRVLRELFKNQAKEKAAKKKKKSSAREVDDEEMEEAIRGEPIDQDDF